MIDFEQLFNSLGAEIAGNQKRLSVDSALGVYFGLSPEGAPRLSFMSKDKAPKLESTKTLKISQGAESDTVYWTCFDLLQNEAKKVYFTFCATLIDAVTGVTSEKAALQAMKKRYLAWKTMFRREIKAKIPTEVLQGLYGELYFLLHHMIPLYGTERSINAWSGPDNKSKDFAIDSTWYEIKTIGANATEVHISSLAQLSSSYDGHLVIIRVESMADEFDSTEDSIGKLLTAILSIITDETTESLFLSKLSAFGFDSSDNSFNSKFDVKMLGLYLVNDAFPRLTEKDINFPEMTNVQYSLNVSALKKYMEEQTYDIGRIQRKLY